MLRFHLNIFNGDGASPDEQGQMLVDVEEARREAIRGIRSILAAEMLEGAIDLHGRIEIADEAGRVLERIGFAEAVEIKG